MDCSGPSACPRTLYLWRRPQNRADSILGPKSYGNFGVRASRRWFDTGLRANILFRLTDEAVSWYTFIIEKHNKCIFFPQSSQPVPERQPVPLYQASESPAICPDGSSFVKHRTFSRPVPSYPTFPERLSMNSVQNIPWYHRNENVRYTDKHFYPNNTE